MTRAGTTLLDLWKEAWAFMDQWGFPLQDHQKDLIKEHVPGKIWKDASVYNMAYFITEHFQSTKWPEMPEGIKKIIHDYKLEMMEKWGWPSWGYNDVKKETLDAA